MVKAFGKACGKEIPYVIKPRRAGDIATCYCDASKAKKELHWEAERGLEENVVKIRGDGRARIRMDMQR